MFQTVDLFLLSCLFLTAISQTDKILPPQNLTLQWIHDFEPKLSWTSPQHSVGNCIYNVSIDTQEGNFVEDPNYTSCSWQDPVIMNGGFMKCSVTAVCNGSRSDPEVLIFSDPELVKNLNCYFYAPQKSHCGWIPAGDTSDLRFFYGIITENAMPELHECPLYSRTDGVKTGCELKATDANDILILFNGTQNNRLVRNTFKKELYNKVRPPPLNWTVTKSKDKFNISWTPPNILTPSDWKFQINYTECNETKSELRRGVTSYQLDRNPDCQYRITIRAEAEHKGETPWSPEKHFDADKSSDALLYMAFIIPLVVATLAALTFICCRRNMEKIFPKIIKPADFISDIVNNNKSNVCNLHTAAGEEETCCEITVLDPQVDRPDC